MRYTLFGTGRAGSNIAAWLSGLGHQVETISHEQARLDSAGCDAHIRNADIVAAAIPDDALPGWYDRWAERLGDRTAIHFSGASVITGMAGFHPLYSFPRHIVSADDLARIAFACPVEGPDFQSIFPGAPNPTFMIHAKDRAQYHALAVLSGNFAAHLWNETASVLSGQYDLSPEDILGPYLKSIVDRFQESPLDSLTGPVARRDSTTIEANLEALSDNPALTALYRAFLASAWPDRKD